MYPLSKCPACQQDNPEENTFCAKCGAPLGVSAKALEIGSMLENRYRISQALGHGGMGSVYKAADTRLSDAPVAVKEMSANALGPGNLEAAIAAFRHEAEILVALRHHALPRVTDFFTDANGRNYLVMDFIDGVSLEKIMRQRGRVPENEALDWCVQLCDVLSYLHRRTPPVIFRDLKPSNVMLTPEGQIKLIDFGIARNFRPESRNDTSYFTSHGFSPPEQYGEGQTDARSDIYALAAVMHTLLTGANPGAKPFSFQQPRELVAEISQQFNDAIMQALELKPDARPATVEDFKAMLPGQGAGAAQPVNSSETVFIPRAFAPPPGGAPAPPTSMPQAPSTPAFRPSAVPQPVPCQRCGAPVAPGMRFCKSCGAPSPQTTPPGPASQPMSPGGMAQRQPQSMPPFGRPPVGGPASRPLNHTQPVQYCRSCGSPLKPGARFCGVCGRPTGL
jgi:serine/threonine-protein kinase